MSLKYIVDRLSDDGRSYVAKINQFVYDVISIVEKIY